VSVLGFWRRCGGAQPIAFASRGIAEGTGIRGLTSQKLNGCYVGIMTSAFRAAIYATEREQLVMRQAFGYAAGVTSAPDKLSAIAAACKALTESDVCYALIGGLAVGIRSGVPRATLDVDFAIESSTPLEPLLVCMESHGFCTTGRFAHSLNFAHSSGEPVQLAFDAMFDAYILRAEPTSLGEFTIPVVTTADLIEMKRRAAADPRRRRSKALRDQADIALLEGDIPTPHEGW